MHWKLSKKQKLFLRLNSADESFVEALKISFISTEFNIKKILRLAIKSIVRYAFEVGGSKAVNNV